MSLTRLIRNVSHFERLPRTTRSLSSSQKICAKLDLKPPPPGPPPPQPVTFDSPSKPRIVHDRPQPKDLPVIQSRAPAIIALGILGISAWAGFIIYATNQERLASSVVRQVLTQLKASPEVGAVLGRSVGPEPTWWMLGQPYVDGGGRITIGKVDISMRVKGTNGAGTIYFTSIRKEKGQPFTILRYKLICDNGVVLDNLHQEGLVPVPA
ncbi:CoA-binding domain protein [Ceratobasidium sp. AG-Ba]|nr:CoA-binding domain protein [Ceratobasidium sp. AG-Ba]